MKPFRFFIMLLVMTLGITQISPAHARFGDILKGVKKAVGLGGGGLSEDKIVQGLKEALQIGTGNAVKIVSRADGYYKNPKIKIPLPGAVKKVEKVLRGVGYGAHVDAFELSMNRAAEQAAPEAKAIFWDTIKKMSFADARKILEGKEDEATTYFKEKTQDRLGETFKPIIHKAMSKVGVTSYYQNLEDKVRSLPFAGSLNLDLEQYVNGRALDGLFLMLAEEERKIRQDPAARVTDLLKEVFGKKER